jgi:hypothetical protein
MTYPHTDQSTVLAQALKDKIELNKVALGLDIVLYGEQNNVPGGKAAVVYCGTKRRPLAGVAGPGGRTDNFMEVIIDVHYSVYNPEEEGRLAADKLAEAVETLLHQDTTVGGIIIHGWVNEWTPGVVFKENSMYRTVRLLYVGRSKTNITVL